MSLISAIKNFAANPNSIRLFIAHKVAGGKPYTWPPRVTGFDNRSLPEPKFKSNRNPNLSSALADAMFAAAAHAQERNAPAQLPSDLLAIPGMSGRRYRALINALIARAPNPRYLEVGAWAGSTLCAAVHNNACVATVIDNWSEFGGPVSHCFVNAAMYMTKSRISILNMDFRQAPFAGIGAYNIYLFDGPHSQQDHFDGLALAMPALDDEFIFIVDDWNWEGVRAGTLDAIDALGLETLATFEVDTSVAGQSPNTAGLASDNVSDWHNGYFMAVLRKTKPSRNKTVGDTGHVD
jgi:hypothetical protein